MVGKHNKPTDTPTISLSWPTRMAASPYPCTPRFPPKMSILCSNSTRGDELLLMIAPHTSCPSRCV